jgi:hypothetical protein
MQIPTVDQLKRALHIQENIEALQKEMALIFGERIPSAAKATGNKILNLTGLGPKKRRKMSKAARAKIAAAQKLRWAKQKGNGKKVVAKVKRKKGKMSAAGRAAIVKAQKARWAKVKAEKEKS